MCVCSFKTSSDISSCSFVCQDLVYMQLFHPDALVFKLIFCPLIFFLPAEKTVKKGKKDKKGKKSVSTLTACGSFDERVRL